MGKVMLVLVIELAVLPVGYGFWLDICALPLVEGTLAGRLALLRHAPVTWTLLHWLLGMASLMATAAFLSVARGLLRPGLLLSVCLSFCLWPGIFSNQVCSRLSVCLSMAGGRLPGLPMSACSKAHVYLCQSSRMPASKAASRYLPAPTGAFLSKCLRHKPHLPAPELMSACTRALSLLVAE